MFSIQVIQAYCHLWCYLSFSLFYQWKHLFSPREVKFPPCEVTFVVSGIFQQGQLWLAWLHHLVCLFVKCRDVQISVRHSQKQVGPLYLNNLWRFCNKYIFWNHFVGNISQENSQWWKKLISSLTTKMTHTPIKFKSKLLIFTLTLLPVSK